MTPSIVLSTETPRQNHRPSTSQAGELVDDLRNSGSIPILELPAVGLSEHDAAKKIQLSFRRYKEKQSTPGSVTVFSLALSTDTGTSITDQLLLN